ncbi:sensor histidine kinase [Paenibacillus sp. strain BS8-2]
MLGWFYRISFYRRIQVALLLFLIFPLLIITGLSYITNKQANEDNVRANMKGILGILANDLSKTANDVTYTVNQYSAAQKNDLFLYLRALRDIDGFINFQNYRYYEELNATTALHVGKLSLVHVNVFYINRVDYPIIGTVNAQDIDKLQDDTRFDHLDAVEAATGLVHWFRADRSGGYELYAKKSVYDPYHQEVLGTLFVGIPDSYFDGVFQSAGDGTMTLYDADGFRLAGMKESPDRLSVAPMSGWMRERIAVPGTSWTLTYDLEVASATGDITQRFWYTIMAVSIVMFVFLFMSTVIARGLNRPIHKLMRVAAQYGEGNSSIRYNATGQDEISLLGESINQMLNNISALIRKVEAEQEEKRAIELYALYSQIQPHFLLNTLNSIKCNLAIEGDQVHSETIDSLMALLRAHLRVHEPLSLGEECKLLAQYISIMRMRNRLNIEFVVDLPENCQEVLVPRLFLQPLVENSIVHGFTRLGRTPRIKVTVSRADGGVEIRIADNGHGVTAEQAEALNSKLEAEAEHTGARGVGLYNVNRRLKLTFGERSRFLVETDVLEGFATYLFLPWHGSDTSGGGEGRANV